MLKLNSINVVLQLTELWEIVLKAKFNDKLTVQTVWNV